MNNQLRYFVLGNKKYAVISGLVPVPSDPLGTVPLNQVLMVSLVVPKFDTNILVKSRMTHTLTLLSSISYSKPMSESLAKEQRQQIEKDAVNAILQAASKSNQRFHIHLLQIQACKEKSFVQNYFLFP